MCVKFEYNNTKKYFDRIPSEPTFYYILIPIEVIYFTISNIVGRISYFLKH